MKISKYPYLLIVCTFCLTSCSSDIEDGVSGLFSKVSSFFGTKNSNSEIKEDEKSYKVSNEDVLSEIYEVMYIENVDKKKDDFQKRINVLNQGGSIEGLYNGIVLDVSFVERSKKAAHPDAINFFADEMTLLIADLHKITDSQVKINKDEIRKTNLDLASGKNIFVLKKVLSEQIIKNMYANSYKEKLAGWYASQSVRLAGAGVELGEGARKWRNEKDEYIHYEWAMKVSEDRIHYEMLIRENKILNFKNKGQI